MLEICLYSLLIVVFFKFHILYFCVSLHAPPVPVRDNKGYLYSIPLKTHLRSYSTLK